MLPRPSGTRLALCQSLCGPLWNRIGTVPFALRSPRSPSRRVPIALRTPPEPESAGAHRFADASGTGLALCQSLCGPLRNRIGTVPIALRSLRSPSRRVPIASGSLRNPSRRAPIPWEGSLLRSHDRPIPSGRRPGRGGPRGNRAAEPSVAQLAGAQSGCGAFPKRAARADSRFASLGKRSARPRCSCGAAARPALLGARAPYCSSLPASSRKNSSRVMRPFLAMMRSSAQKRLSSSSI